MNPPALLLATVILVFQTSLAWAQDLSFKGKSIRVVMGYPSGGGVDAEARLLARFLEKHLAGNPSVIVQNMPGAGGLVAANWFEQFGKPDGQFLHYTSSSNITRQALGGDEVKYNILNWELVGSVLRGTSVAIIKPDKLDRLKGSGNPLAIGSRSGEDTWAAIFLWGAEFLKWNVRWILGYGGGGELRVAFQRGETDIYATATATALRELVAEGYQPFVQKGRLVPDGSFKRRAEFTNIPTFDELLGDKKPTGVAWQAYVTMSGADDGGRPLQLPHKTPPEIVRAFREAFGRLKGDKEFQKELDRVAGDDAELLFANEAEPVLRRLLTVTPGVKEYTTALIKKYMQR
jgi:tripartite-type tricarboxylate transporter receptor subunit TctC